MVVALFIAGADVNSTEYGSSGALDNKFNDGTALATPAANVHINITRFLFTQGADPNDWIALKLAAFKNKELLDLVHDIFRARYPRGRGDAVITGPARAIEVND